AAREEMIEMEKEKSRKEGLREGLKEGLKEGLEKGQQKTISSITRRLKSMGMSDDDIAKATELGESDA
ncbi:MAG: hypothetical protein J6S82_06080, partial [Bacteroidales bacterium]|nr:hypothetical protein [Bacteroidales bacterium]